jgi:PAS domain S-box-containing protein
MEDSIEKLYTNPEDRQKALNKLLKDGQVTDYEVDFKAKDGTIKHTSLNAKVVYNSTGSPSYIDGFIRDITIRKKAEKALQESEKFLKETQTVAVIGNGSYDHFRRMEKL